MESVRNWSDLRRFGIDCLTGEACGVGMRLLCDVDHRGLRILHAFFGCKLELAPPANCSEGVMGSIMLPSGLLRELAAFCMLHEGALHVYVVDGSINPCMTEDEIALVDNCWSPEEIVRVYRRTGDARQGMSNVHQMSGRVW